MRVQFEAEDGRVLLSFEHVEYAVREGITVAVRKRATLDFPAKYLAPMVGALRYAKAATDEGEGDDESIDLEEGELSVSTTLLPVAAAGRK
jgi:hypothetical protein